MVSIIEMTLLHDARYSAVLLRPKDEVKPLTQSAEKWICMRKWPVPGGAIYFHQVVVVRLIPEFFFPTRTVYSFGKTNFDTERTRGAKTRKIQIRIERFNFRQFLADFRGLGPPSKNSKCHNSINIGI